MSAYDGEGAPYAGLRVLDLSQGIAGPYCGSLLARQGANVVKVEPPAGDWARLMGGGKDGLTALSIGANVGKRAICIDATLVEGRALLLQCVERADVVIESFRPGVMDKLGLSQEALHACNPGLVVVSITGFGPDGPYRARAGSDSVIQALSGMMVMNRDGAGTPRRIGMLAVDAACGVYAAQSVGAALFAQAKSGLGRRLDISLLAVAASLQTIPILDHFMFAGEKRVPVTVPSGTFQTADGFINVTALRNEMFFGLCRALGQDEWVSHPDWATNEQRLQHAADINARIADVLVGATTASWVERLQAQDVLCAAVNDYDAFVDDPQVRHAQVFGRLMLDGVAGVAAGLPLPAVPGLPPGAHERERTTVPRLGRDTRAVLAEMGLPETEIARLIEQRVVFTSASAT
ncbi:CaiB/BaiF CoA transferase family protein [Paraburkholderia sp. BCC1886]|uniref:CaiB/BaiF CoA transferase family protein n=1 Tax=Paraburkholderia sp. BCC1886 TaxID=2562670 RepID=UPI0011828CAF|nr:CoA transferase [Paraburkholderia sp. BCC1886]